MFVLGLQGSPRIKGNIGILLSIFLNEAESLGAYIKRLDVARMNISPCQECGACEKEGFCPIDDDMQQIFFQECPIRSGLSKILSASRLRLCAG